MSGNQIKIHFGSLCCNAFTVAFPFGLQPDHASEKTIIQADIVNGNVTINVNICIYYTWIFADVNTPEKLSC